MAAKRRGRVYLIRADFGHHAPGFIPYKIGVSNDPSRRVRNFGQTPFRPVVEHQFLSANPIKVERALHRRFAGCKLRGEWFLLTPIDVREIKGVTVCDFPADLPTTLTPPIVRGLGRRGMRKANTGFGGRLKALREAAGLTQRALAERAGMHPLGVAKLEQGVSEPHWPNVLALADALGVGLESFRAGGAETVKRPPGRPPAKPPAPPPDAGPRRKGRGPTA